MGDTANGKGSVNQGFSSESQKEEQAHAEIPVTVDADIDDEIVDKSFGWGAFKSPKLGKYLSNLFVFSLLSGSAVMLSVAGLNSLNIHLNSLAVQFQLSDTDLADVKKAYSISIVISSALFSYLGTFQKINIPVTIGVAAMLNGICLMIPSFFHFAHPYDLDVNASLTNPMFMSFLCPPPVLPNTSAAFVLPQADPAAYRVLVSSQAVSGFFMPIIAILSIVYIDNNATKKAKLGIFLGIFTLLYENASLSAMAMNGFFAKIAIDLEDTDLDPLDTRFVGAWWLPILLVGICLFVIGSYLVQFPRRLKSQRRQVQALAAAARSYAVISGDVSPSSTGSDKPYDVVMDEVKSATKEETSTKEGAEKDVEKDPKEESQASPPSPDAAGWAQRDGSIVFGSIAIPRIGVTLSVMDIPAQLFRTFKNPIFVLILIDVLFLAMPTNPLVLFRPLYQMYEYSADVDAVTMSGIAYSVTGFVGGLFGAFLCTRIHSLRGYALVLLVGYGLSFVISPFYFLFDCDNQFLHGYTGKYGIAPSNESQVCDCNPYMSLPVCGDDGLNYFSPCYAGCQGGDGNIFTNCSLISTAPGGEAKSGLCYKGCEDAFIGYNAIYAIVTLFTQMTIVPRYLIVIRLLEPRDRAFGIGMVIFFFYLFSIPAPKVFEHIFDDVGCVMELAGACQLYEHNKIRYLLSGMEVSINAVLFFSALLMVLILTMVDSRLKLQQHQQHTSKESGVTHANTRL